MDLPKNGERWVVRRCMDHDNLPGVYIWNYTYHDKVSTHSIIRIKCGCVYKEPPLAEGEVARETVGALS